MPLAEARTKGSIDEALTHGRALLNESPLLAARQAREILAVDPANAEALRLLARSLRATGDDDSAERAELDAIAASVHDPELVQAAHALLDNALADAERILRPRLKTNPFDVAAIRMMAELAGRLGRYGDAENLLRRALELAPGFAAARGNLATVLYRQNRAPEAIAELDRLLDADPANPAHRNLKAAALGRVGGFDEAIALYEDVLQRFPDQPKVWMSYGHVLKTVGRQTDSIAAYRRAITIAPGLGEVWWSLANLKTIALDADDIAAMTAALEQTELGAEDRFHLHFALGKALEDQARAEGAFAHYAEGNRLRRAMIDYDPQEISSLVERSRALFTAEFFGTRAGHGSTAADPIFILGMPRAGSTLIEQILASHALVEGTHELPDIGAIALRLGRGDARYPECADAMNAEAFATLGNEYLERTRVNRKTNRPFFIDKMPNNWAHVPLIHLILPNAKIIDARRHPLACCFSNFKQHFARGQGFSYALEDMARYYRDYVKLMAHVDAVLPGRVHRVVHEALVDDTEAEVRRLLAYLGLDFDPGCLRFWETDRPVRTASSEQVRRPISREGLDQWQAFEPWLDLLKNALGPVLDRYPEAPPP
ncbi:tetratricopeptide repeat-containing sulfotransferase family protein [Sphingomonas cavernae]|uniref:Sulfotransferase family protein n=1 Tax=Sphingomonas cavernae TaxID=2320861 RepID=A0A418WQH5_9SPHN|nr:tetratricopeptide repeat-containing sulfotransferase family protein [Sphingomonas cavernae]RJF93456.1 sulfotransferase family protein [Sphingomonas cavernae]